MEDKFSVITKRRKDHLNTFSVIKDICTRDSIWKRGDYNYLEKDSSTLWTTHTKDSYKELPRQSTGNQIADAGIAVLRNDTNISFGSEPKRYFDPISKEYGKQTGKAAVLAMTDTEIHLADFCPRYMKDKKSDAPSVYQSSYNLQGKASKLKLDTSERGIRTNEQRKTHFVFGIDNDKSSTENCRSFRNMNDVSPEVDDRDVINCHASNIFKPGDWNARSQSLLGLSVTAKDFSQKHRSGEASRTRNKLDTISSEDVPPYKGTHVNFGCSNEKHSSFYYKDFMSKKENSVMKPIIAPPPPSSKVMMELDETRKINTTKQADYVKYNDCSRSATQERVNAVTKNKMQHKETHISLSQDKQMSPCCHLTTITRNGYGPPKLDCLTNEHAKQPLARYRHMDSDGALLHPRKTPVQSEVKANYIPPSQRNVGKLKVLDYSERQRDDKSTHFKFGTDAEVTRTEQNSQFKQPLELDPRLIAAGVKDQGISSFSNNNKHFCNEKEHHTPKFNNYGDLKLGLSTMTDDYQEMTGRSFTSPQRKLIDKLEKCHPQRTMSSHYFHMDTSGVPVNSVTKMDFSPPERIQGINSSCIKG